jgi:hypothetical protein
MEHTYPQMPSQTAGVYPRATAIRIKILLRLLRLACRGRMKSALPNEPQVDYFEAVRVYHPLPHTLFLPAICPFRMGDNRLPHHHDGAPGLENPNYGAILNHIWKRLVGRCIVLTRCAVCSSTTRRCFCTT